MSTQIDFRTMPANVPVLCIPRVYPNISESRIRKIFDDLNMGTIERIDIVAKATARHSAKPGEKVDGFNRVFVHFRRWNDTENANIARERLLNGKEIKIIYDDPWFWKISAYREVERKPSAPSERRAKLEFDSDENTAKPLREPRRRDDSRERRRPDDRRRDDSRERRRPDDRRRDERRPDERRRDERRRPDERRRDDSRERRRPDERRRDDSRERRRPDKQEEQRDEIHKVQPKSPSCSPPRERPAERENHEDEGLKVDYGNVAIPCLKNKNKKFYPATEISKKPLKIEDDKEEE